MSGKSKRTVSLESGTIDISDKRKSVFDRLGANSSSSRANYDQEEVKF